MDGPTDRRLVHPGPVAADRIAWLSCRATPRRVVLHAGASLLDAAAAALDATGGDAAWLRLRDVAADRLSYVQPAPAPGDGRVAFYTATATLERTTIHDLGLHLGRRDGAPFAHGHGIWSPADGPARMGHVLADRTFLSRDAEVDMIDLRGAMLTVVDDAETGFALFRPEARGGAPSPNAALATIRPNEVLHDALAAVASDARLAAARVHGLGSLIGTAFADGPAIGTDATEILVLSGRIDADGPRLDVASVGFDGAHRSGRLASGNRVCVTCEALLVADDG